MTAQPFQPIRDPDGYLDEAATHKAFETYMGGRARADQIDGVWRDTYPGISMSKEQVFRTLALARGFSHAEIDAFLIL